MMAVDLGLLLQNAQTAFANGQQDHGLFLLNYAASFAGDALASSHLPLDVAIGLDAGFVRKANEDCVFTLQGMRPETREGFGLFLICDGMGGHTHGLYAAHLAVASIVETVLPHLMDGKAPHDDWMHVLSTGVQSANRAIYLRNQSMQATTLRRNETRQDKRETEGRLTSLMGTTVTAALVLHNTAYVCNVGDSRTYCYQPEEGLTRITLDHSLVASMFNLGALRFTPEEIYTHPQRNQIVRSLGTRSSVEVDTFHVPLQDKTILLLCSDGLWEMTRDARIEEILSLDWANAPYMANRLLALAKEGGAKDNVGLVVVKLNGSEKHNDISTMATIIQPVDAPRRLVPISSHAS